MPHPSHTLSPSRAQPIWIACGSSFPLTPPALPRKWRERTPTPRHGGGYKNQDQFAGARQQLGYGGGDEGWQPELFSRPSHDLGQDFGQEVGLSNAAYDTVERAELALMELEDMCNSCQDVGMCDECWVETRKNEMREVGKL